MLSAAIVFITIVLALSFGIFAGWAALAAILQTFSPASALAIGRKPIRAVGAAASATHATIT